MSKLVREPVRRVPDALWLAASLAMGAIAASLAAWFLLVDHVSTVVPLTSWIGGMSTANLLLFGVMKAKGYAISKTPVDG